MLVDCMRTRRCSSVKPALFEDLGASFFSVTAFLQPPSDHNVDTLFARMKRNRVALPDPFTVDECYHVRKRGVPSRRLAIFIFMMSSPFENGRRQSAMRNQACQSTILRNGNIRGEYPSRHCILRSAQFDTISQMINLIPPPLSKRTVPSNPSRIPFMRSDTCWR